MKKTTSASANALQFLIISMLLAAICIALIFFPNNTQSATNAISPDGIRTVVIDAGHGGADGGATGIDGTLEKDINLLICRDLSALFNLCGYNTVMTRETDVMLSTPQGNGSAKMQDLKQRLSIASAYPDALTVSIHCNKFPDASCKGLQVYYSDNETAQHIASNIQKNALMLQPDNHRSTKKADSSIYLLHRAKTPTVLVECGFLSNAGDLEDLKDESYRKKLAIVILSGITNTKEKGSD